MKGGKIRRKADENVLHLQVYQFFLRLRQKNGQKESEIEKKTWFALFIESRGGVCLCACECCER